MKKELIPYNTIDFLSKTMLDYISGSDALKPFYRAMPSIEGIIQAAAERSFSREKRVVVSQVLKEQLMGLDLTEAELMNLEKMDADNTFTVTTGHQLCLMGGPLYFFLKIISAINLADELNKRNSPYHFVPMFWMATEDHDFEEINHLNLFGKKIEWKRANGNAVGRMSLEGIDGFKEELYSLIGDGAHASEIKELFESSYGSSQNLAEATRKFVRYFFKSSGLLIIDGDHQELKRLFYDPLKVELESQLVKNVVSDTIRDLAVNYKIQANPAEVNLFYLSDSKRIKIERENGQFEVGDQKMELTRMMEVVSDHPERFSPNVLMRPLYQECILPNLAYIGGGGELAYWLELKNLFDINNIPFPFLVLRNSLLWLDRKNKSSMDQLEIETQDLFLREEDLISKYASGLLYENVNISVEIERLKDLFDQLALKAKAIDPSLEHSARAQHVSAEKSIRKLEQKMIKSIKMKNETSINRLRKLKQRIFPNGKLQERYESFIPFYLEHGEHFIEILRKKLDPLDFRLTVITEE